VTLTFERDLGHGKPLCQINRSYKGLSHEVKGWDKTGLTWMLGNA